MSTAIIGKNKHGSRVVRVNDANYYLDRIQSITVRPNGYEFDVTHRNGQTFVVWGGKKSGGGVRQWYCDWSTGGSSKCTSLVDALKLIDGM